MSTVLYIQNGEHDHPGLLAKVVHEAGVRLDVIQAWDGEPVPVIANGWSGIVIGGGYMSAYETRKYPFLLDEVRLLQASRNSGRPVLGLCLGAQLMAAAFGGKVFPNRAPEVGFFDVDLSPEAKTDPLWCELPETIRPVHWHGDTFTLPQRAVLLASSEMTENQLFRIGDSLYGVQFHLEIDVPVLYEMVDTDMGWLEENGVDPDEFLSDAEEAIPELEPLARTVFNRWLSLLR